MKATKAPKTLETIKATSLGTKTREALKATVELKATETMRTVEHGTEVDGMMRIMLRRRAG